MATSNEIKNIVRYYPKFAAYVQRKQLELGSKFSTESLDIRFAPFFGTEDRIKVQPKYGKEITGTVGVTTGWKPIFLLMRRSNSIGSSDTLGKGDRIIGVKREGDRTYRPYFE